MAIESEDAAKVAKETIYGTVSTQVHKVKSFKQAGKKISHSPDDKTLQMVSKWQNFRFSTMLSF